eukprot:m.427756 g.427756  ORF g.427756 m.427756 type:complete len:804 (+) comp21365_c0_seq2:148-2559(+)
MARYIRWSTPSPERNNGALRLTKTQRTEPYQDREQNRLFQDRVDRKQKWSRSPHSRFNAANKSPASSSPAALASQLSITANGSVHHTFPRENEDQTSTLDEQRSFEKRDSSKVVSQEERPQGTKELIQSRYATSPTTATGTIQGLCPEDKQRVARLVAELSRETRLKNQHLAQLEATQNEFESRLQQLLLEQTQATTENALLRARLTESQQQLSGYKLRISQLRQDGKGKNTPSAATLEDNSALSHSYVYGTESDTDGTQPRPVHAQSTHAASESSQHRHRDYTDTSLVDALHTDQVSPPADARHPQSFAAHSRRHTTAQPSQTSAEPSAGIATRETQRMGDTTHIDRYVDATSNTRVPLEISVHGVRYVPMDVGESRGRWNTQALAHNRQRHADAASGFLHRDEQNSACANSDTDVSNLTDTYHNVYEQKSTDTRKHADGVRSANDHHGTGAFKNEGISMHPDIPFNATARSSANGQIAGRACSSAVAIVHEQRPADALHRQQVPPEGVTGDMPSNGAAYTHRGHPDFNGGGGNVYAQAQTTRGVNMDTVPQNSMGGMHAVLGDRSHSSGLVHEPPSMWGRGTTLPAHTVPAIEAWDPAAPLQVVDTMATGIDLGQPPTGPAPQYIQVPGGGVGCPEVEVPARHLAASMSDDVAVADLYGQYSARAVGFGATPYGQTQGRAPAVHAATSAAASRGGNAPLVRGPTDSTPVGGSAHLPGAERWRADSAVGAATGGAQHAQQPATWHDGTRLPPRTGYAAAEAFNTARAPDFNDRWSAIQESSWMQNDSLVEALDVSSTLNGYG